MMKKILHVLTVKTTRSEVFRALTTEEGLSGWWSTRVKTDGKEGSVIDFTFVADFNPDMKVTRLEQDQAVHWRCIGGHDKWLDNTFAFDLSDTELGTQLTFTQIYARELSDVDYGTYNFNWGYYLHSLKQYCETGEGTPFSA